MRSFPAFALTACAILSACTQSQDADFNPNISVETVRILSSAEFAGREAGTDGGRRSADKIIRIIEQHSKFKPTRQNFAFMPKGGETPLKGQNLIVTIPGKNPAGSILVATAHYDHLGTRGDDIYFGADDNASGVGGLFALLQSFEKNAPKHTVILVFLDAEEQELQGAKALVENYEPIADRPLLNLNLDMIAQNQKGELYMAGSYHTPALKQLVQNATQGTGIDIKFGHDRPEDGDDDWTSQSDHSVFHKTGVPFVYFGVEDHKHYHKPTDTFETLPIDFYIKSLHAITNTARALDANLAKYAKPVSN